MKKQAAVLLTLSLLTFISCDKEVNLELPEASSKLVVLGFISPYDSVISIRVNLSRPLFNKYPNNYPSGYNDWASQVLVSISDHTQQIYLKYDSINKHHSIERYFLNIIPGKTYYLNVASPDGKKITSYCTVPAQKEHSPVVNITQKQNKSGDYGTYFLSTIQWQDDILTKDYYSFNALAINAYSSMEEYVYASNRLVSDLGTEGKIIHLNQEFSKSKIEKIDDWYFNLYILDIDEHYFHYHKYLRSTGSIGAFLEPTTVYSNIEGGLGIFCAYNVSVYKYELAEIMTD
ncbi:MAG: DUF4249 domain-containing protein [Bacteroidota bacterium]|nr:DUF4249 domain-containing protein [Bacteroidota bacterium]